MKGRYLVFALPVFMYLFYLFIQVNMYVHNPDNHNIVTEEIRAKSDNEIIKSCSTFLFFRSCNPKCDFRNIDLDESYNLIIPGFRITLYNAFMLILVLFMIVKFYNYYKYSSNSFVNFLDDKFSYGWRYKDYRR